MGLCNSRSFLHRLGVAVRTIKAQVWELPAGFVLPHAKAGAAEHHRLQILSTFQALLAQQLNSWYFMFACFSPELSTSLPRAAQRCPKHCTQALWRVSTLAGLQLCSCSPILPPAPSWLWTSSVMSGRSLGKVFAPSRKPNKSSLVLEKSIGSHTGTPGPRHCKVCCAFSRDYFLAG